MINFQSYCFNQTPTPKLVDRANHHRTKTRQLIRPDCRICPDCQRLLTEFHRFSIPSYFLPYNPRPQFFQEQSSHASITFNRLDKSPRQTRDQALHAVFTLQNHSRNSSRIDSRVLSQIRCPQSSDFQAYPGERRLQLLAFMLFCKGITQKNGRINESNPAPQRYV